MAKPTQKVQIASSDVNLPITGLPNKEQPAGALLTTGWDLGNKPAVEEFNWLFDNVRDWIDHLETKTDQVVSATELVEGLVELATQAEVDADTGGSLVVTSDTLNAFTGNNFIHISPISIYNSSTANEDVNLDLRAYLPNGGEAILSFDFRLSGTTNSFSWAGISPSNDIPTWDVDLHAEMTAIGTDVSSQTSGSAGNLFKVSSTGQYSLHKTGSAMNLKVRLIAYRPWK